MGGRESDGLGEGSLGRDFYGQLIMPGDLVEVVEEEGVRKNNPEYLYCGKGKRGRAQKGFGRVALEWSLIVQFPTARGPQDMGCTDVRLKKIKM
ncbi:hypothetical protein HY797_03750 [Candidatus Falkowbacteria bacterium]|nr:hypothetical protein [Candidatus Falkowbacteria bacterium]